MIIGELFRSRRETSINRNNLKEENVSEGGTRNREILGRINIITGYGKEYWGENSIGGKYSEGETNLIRDDIFL